MPLAVAPDLTRPGFVPSYPAYLPDGENDFTVELRPFSPQAMDTFCQIERPRRSPEGELRLVSSTTGHDLAGNQPDDDGDAFFQHRRVLRGNHRRAPTVGRG